MPYLGDYIGQLLSEFTIARMQADIETVRIAELYASHSLLRHMPVPHFRLPELDIEVPVAIKQVEESKEDSSPRGGVSIAEMRKAFDELLAKELQKQRIEPTPAGMNAMRVALDERSEALTLPKETAVDVNRVADGFSTTVARALRNAGVARAPIEPTQIQNVEAELRITARLAFLKLRKPPPRLNVLVTTQEIREAGPGDVVTRIRLKISEQGVEWTTIESEGGTRDKLVPE